MKTTGLAIACVLLAGCATRASNSAALAPEQVCMEPRPQMCTMQYDPVCARHGDGRLETFSNGCNACADVTVVAWRPGACAE